MNSPKQNKRYLAHILALLALVVYLASANYIFCYLLTVDGEAQVCSVNIPEETGNIKYYIDTVEEHQIDWKCLIAISGWAFIEGKRCL